MTWEDVVDMMMIGDEKTKKPIAQSLAFDVRSFDFVMLHLEYSSGLVLAFDLVELGSKTIHRRVPSSASASDPYWSCWSFAVHVGTKAFHYRFCCCHVTFHDSYWIVSAAAWY